MQPGGGARRSSGGEASPSSSDSFHQQQLRQSTQQQQQQMRQSDGEENLLSFRTASGLHGAVAGSSFPSSSGGVPQSQQLRKFRDLPQQHGSQLSDGNQNEGQGLEQHVQNTAHQAYLHFGSQNVQQQKSYASLPSQQQGGKFSMAGPPRRDQDMHVNNLKMQELVSLQTANQAHTSLFKKSADQHLSHGEKHIEQGQASNEQRNEQKLPQAAIEQPRSKNITRHLQSTQPQASTGNTSSDNQILVAQLQAMQTWALERNIDLFLPANANLIAQILPIWQSSKFAATQKPSDTSTVGQQSCLPPCKPHVNASPVGSETSAHGKSLSDISDQTGSMKNRHSLLTGSLPNNGVSMTTNSDSIKKQQQLAAPSRETQAARPTIAMGSGGAVTHPPQSGRSRQSVDHSNYKNTFIGNEEPQIQNLMQMQQLNQHVSQSTALLSDVLHGQVSSQEGLAQVPQQHVGFTRQQLHVLKAQIIAFRRLKRGNDTIPNEVLQAIAPPPLDPDQQQGFTSSRIVNRERLVMLSAEVHAKHAESKGKAVCHAPSSRGDSLTKEEPSIGEDKAAQVSALQGATSSIIEPIPTTITGKMEQSSTTHSKQEVKTKNQAVPIKSDCNAGKGETVPTDSVSINAAQLKKPISTSGAPLPKDATATRKYPGPLFDFPHFTKRPDSSGLTTIADSTSLALAYDITDLLFEEGIEALNKKRAENLKKINCLLAINLERKRIRPDLVLKLQIEEKKLRLSDLQTHMRDEVDQEQQEIMAMSDRPYRKFVKQCERQRTELSRQIQFLQKITKEKELKSIFQWRKKLLEAHWAIRDARITRNRGVAKYHERMLKEFSKRKDDDRNKRMEALKNNDVDRYREMLLEQQVNVPGDAAQRYNVLSLFLSQTEEYLQKLGGKITATKNHQEVEEAKNFAAAATQFQGLSEEEVKAAVACAGEEVMIRNRFSEMNALKDNLSDNKYYNLAHAVNESVLRQPSMLRAGTLRDYQLVGLQWMLSLYNNKLNGILADEMGLGKTVQVMALIAYLMEFKGNYGPHLIIVPNAVLVNWKSELLNWLPSIKCIFYVGAKDQRSRLFSHEVRAMKFNVLVTTYEFIMYDRAKLSKIDWKYIIIDEAQRMKNRESVLARDLDKYHCQRRLLLTGTPLQVMWLPCGFDPANSVPRTIYTGWLLYRDIMEPYMPVRVLRQLGYLQPIPNAIHGSQKAVRSWAARFYKVEHSDVVAIDDWNMFPDVSRLPVSRYQAAVEDPTSCDGRYLWCYYRRSHPRLLDDGPTSAAVPLSRSNNEYNDLKELWSLLNLLLPEIFDNQKVFHDWFSKPFQKDDPSQSEEDDWLETEKKVIIIHRLHQNLEPFMLRRRVEDVEGSLPRKVSVVLRCRMSAIQGAIYDWIKSTGTIRVDPEAELRRVEKNPMYQMRMYKNLNNKCMELRKACNHPLLNYPYFSDYSKDFIVRSCGKLWMLDRILIKLHKSGHRVLLFSTMTKLLDILEEYLQWQRLVYRRIDGTTSLEDRESAIVDFNSPDSDCFIFLLSIRAAGRGLNLQSADTVVIYDPDPNPQNEEQAVARAHRIGQKREVKVIYMEAVVDKVPSCQKEDYLRNGGTGDIEDDLAGKDRYIGSIESLIRSNIQQYKIDMADEVINAGRFDQRTTHEERRMTLETLLHDEERYQETVHDVPSLHEVNCMIARSEEEVKLFDQMDEEFEWTGEMVKHNQVPKWLRSGLKELNASIASLSKKPFNTLAGGIDLESNESISGLSPTRTERRSGRLRDSSTTKSYIYRELDDDNDDEDGQYSDASSEDKQEEDREIGEYEDTSEPINKDQSDEEMVYDGGGYAASQVIEGIKKNSKFEKAGFSGSSSERRLAQPATPSMSLQKFGSLSALDSMPKRMSEELEGEIGVSGDSHLDLQPSDSWTNDREDGEEEQVLQPKIKRKRSLRIRPRRTVEKLEKSGNEHIFSQHGSQLASQVDQGHAMKSRNDPEIEAFRQSVSHRHDKHISSLKRRNLPSRKTSVSVEDAIENSKGNLRLRAMSPDASSLSVTKMSDSLHRKCKNVISKLLRRIDKEGHQLVPLLHDLWNRTENSSFASAATMPSNLFDLRRIDRRLDNLEYNGVMDFMADIHLMLQNTVQYFGNSHEFSMQVRSEAKKLHDLFSDIMKIAFPDMDLREAKSSLKLPSTGVAIIAPFRKQRTLTSVSFSQSMRHKMIPEVEPELGRVNAASSGLLHPDKDVSLREDNLPKELKPRQEQALHDHVPPSLTHPGDLVICKGKRKDRDKSAVKQRVGSALPLNPGRISSLPASSGRAGPALSPSTGRSNRVPSQRAAQPPPQQAVQPVGWSHQSQQQRANGCTGGGALGAEELQWAKPVKRLRSDAAKRRPSHM